MTVMNVHQMMQCLFGKKEIAAKAAILRADQKAVVIHQRWPGEMNVHQISK
jgi:hypothetical protein